MTIATTITALQAVHAGISGVTRAPTTLPNALQTADLPTVVVWPGPTPATEGWIAAPGGYHVRRIYLVTVYVAGMGEGADYDQAYQECITLLQAFGEAYVTDANQNLSGAVDTIFGPITDTGIRRVDYLDQAFHGFTFQVPVKEKVTP